jgi:hypothetical protein
MFVLRIRIRNPTGVLPQCLALGLSLEPDGYRKEMHASTPAQAWTELWRLVQALETGGVEVIEAQLTWALTGRVPQ